MTIEWVGLAEDQNDLSALLTALQQHQCTVKWYSTMKELTHCLQNTHHAVVLLKESLNYDIYKLCKEITRIYPNTFVILITQLQNLDYKKALRVGAVDAIELPSDSASLYEQIGEIQGIVQLKLERNNGLREIENAYHAKVITICSSKGGVGKTTVAVNLASSLAYRGMKVAIMDIDLQFGDVAMMFDEKPKKSIYDWVKEEYEFGQGNIERYVTKHRSGVHILASPPRPEFAEVIQSNHIMMLISELRANYDFLVIDTPPFLNDTTVAALECSDEILLITVMDLPTLKNCRLFIETLESVGIQTPVKVILNKDAKRKGLIPETIETILRLPLSLRIPNDENRVVFSVNKGMPLILEDRKSIVAKKVLALTCQVAGKPKVKKKTLLSKLKLSFKG